MPAARSRETAVVNCSPSAVTQARNPRSLAGSTPSPPSRSSTSASGATQPQAGRDDGRGQAGVPGQRRRHGQDGGDTAAPGGLDDAVDGEVGLRRRRRAEQHRVVGQPDVPGRPLGLRVHGDRLHAQPVAGRDHGAGGRPAAGHEHALDTQLCHGCPLLRSPVRHRTTLCGNRSAP